MSVVRAAVDTGGTFTDVVLQAGSDLCVVKVPSTPSDPSRAVAAGLRLAAERAGIALPVALLVHGSTVATNALLESRFARAALVTNRGFEDVLAIGRQARPRLYALGGERPDVPVEAWRRIGIGGRLSPDGSELEPLEGGELAALAGQLQGLGAESVAVVLLHSYANGCHEAEVASRLRAAGLSVSVSSELLPEHREYERLSTTVVNAAVGPVMAKYLTRVADAGIADHVRVMSSAGGALSVARASAAAAHTILSGPAGGVAGALHVAGRHGIRDIITFDMGGTSTDVSLCPGRALRTREAMVAGLPVALPMLDVHTVGAGGGSLAWLDRGGALRTGPQSAGSEPGPVCYGRGGTQLTVTDANVALGRLVTLDGTLPLDPSLVDPPLAELARAMGCVPGEAAEGIVAVVNAAMEGALRVISVERGHDAAAFTLVPFGGAAGLHAIALAERLEIRQLLLPPAPGVLSAYGMLVAPLRREVARSVLLVDPADAELEPYFLELSAAAHAAVADQAGDDDVAIHLTVAARYRGQSHELVVPAAGWRDGFHDAHQQRYGYARRDSAVEAVTLLAEAVAAAPAVPVPGLPRAAGAAQAVGSGTVRFEGEAVTAQYHQRDDLLPGHRVHGPALLLEATATAWLPPGWTAEVLHDGSCLVTPRN